MTRTRKLVLKRLAYLALIEAGIAGMSATVIYTDPNPFTVLLFANSLAGIGGGLFGLITTVDL